MISDLLVLNLKERLSYKFKKFDFEKQLLIYVGVNKKSNIKMAKSKYMKKNKLIFIFSWNFFKIKDIFIFMN